MKSKYIIVLGGVTVIAFGAYLFFLKKKKSMLITAGEGSLGIQEAPNSTTSSSNITPPKSGSASSISTPSSSTVSSSSGSTTSPSSGSTTPVSSPSGSAVNQLPINTAPYSIDEARVKSLEVTALISAYLTKIKAEEIEEPNKDYSLLRKNYKTLKELISYFKSKGASIINNEFISILPNLSRVNADRLISIYPKLYLNRVLADFQTYFKQHELDYALTPSESVFSDEIGYDVLEKDAINSWILKTTPQRVVIKEAFYGRGSNLIDIKNKIVELIKSGTYSYPVTNQFAEIDPEKGKGKGSYVNYTVDGVNFTLTNFNSATKGFNKNWNNGAVEEGQIAVLIK